MDCTVPPGFMGSGYNVLDVILSGLHLLRSRFEAKTYQLAKVLL